MYWEWLDCYTNSKWFLAYRRPIALSGIENPNFGRGLRRYIGHRVMNRFTSKWELGNLGCPEPNNTRSFVWQLGIDPNYFGLRRYKILCRSNHHSSSYASKGRWGRSGYPTPNNARSFVWQLGIDPKYFGLRRYKILCRSNHCSSSCASLAWRHRLKWDMRSVTWHICLIWQANKRTLWFWTRSPSN